ncbi:ComEC/Rec2 family competence protein [Roseibium sp.]|uniref:ComEC/Rec2 family competence protein n=1 Tax=Roseibium sp. TaxID=1936156 RepID=UPI003A971F33
MGDTRTSPQEGGGNVLLRPDPETSRSARLGTSGDEVDRATIKPRRSGRPVSAALLFIVSRLGRAQAADPASLRRQMRSAEDQRLLRCGFAFALGILIYMWLPEEPKLLALIGVFALLLFGWFRNYRAGTGSSALLLCAMVAGGATTAGVRTWSVEGPRLGVPVTVTLVGHVSDRLETRRGPRLIVLAESYDSRGRVRTPGEAVDATSSKGRFPERVRLSVPKASGARVGDRLTAKVRLFPPAGPVRPGGYDFSFWAYFDGLGATGFSYGVPTVGNETAGGLLLWTKRGLEDVRLRVSDRIRQLLGAGESTELAVALLVGQRGGLSEDSEEALRAAGLAHVLAISGLHMALFAGGAYAGILLLLSFFEGVALRWPTHKIAAIAALFAACLYLALSGASVATQRSFLMIGLVFAGALMARKGISLHSVALAGLVLLVVSPEKLLHAGFQMSFAAVICLVAVYETWRTSRLAETWRARQAGARPLGRVAAMCVSFVGGVLVTAFVAGLATGLIGAHHFGRYAPLGIIGNLLGMPLFSLLVMPAGVLAILLLPLGLAVVPLAIMKVGLDGLLGIARWTAGLGSGSGEGTGLGTLAPPGGIETLALVSALFVFVLMSGKWRAPLSMALAVPAIVLIALDRPPDIQIPDQGVSVAARDENGVLRLSAARASFQNEMWLQREGDVTGRPDGDGVKTLGMVDEQRRCDGGGCVVRAFSGVGDRTKGQGGFVQLAFPKVSQSIARDCIHADIIVSDLMVSGDCGAALHFDRSRRAGLGSVSIWLSAAPPKVAFGWSGKAVTVRTGQVPAPSRQQGAGSGQPGSGAQTPIKIYWQGAKTDPPRPWHR